MQFTLLTTMGFDSFTAAVLRALAFASFAAGVALMTLPAWADETSPIGQWKNVEQGRSQTWVRQQ